MKITWMLFRLLLVSTPFVCFANTGQPVSAKHGMVVTEQQIASQIGVDILRAGGNAIDAAVAVGYALAVVKPCCGNLGGGGFMTIHLANGKDVFLNFREKAPLNATKNMYLDAHRNMLKNASTQGYLAVATPGTVLGLDVALRRYGTLSRQKVMAPAIHLAQKGYVVTRYDAQQFMAYANAFRTQPNVAAIFLKNGKPYAAGELLIQKDLANTLKQIAEKGPDFFYKGRIAHAVVKASHVHGGILTLQDFAKYNVEELSPLRCTYHGYTIISAPPPSSGGIAICEMLNILENFSLSYMGYHSARSTYDVVEAMRYAFADRNTKLGDPDFVKNPVAQLLAKNYALQLSKQIRDHHSENLPTSAKSQPELTDTTHYSIVDSKGNAVAVTYTLNGFFGAGVIADKTGFFLNDEMDDFTIKQGTANKFGLVQSDANAIQPGKRPLSSMSPTIVMKNGRVFMVLGSPGGPRIITAVLLTLLNVIEYGMNIQKAVDAPRFHYQSEPDIVAIEPLTFNYATIKKLEIMGYHIIPQKKWAAVEAILIDPFNGTLYGANDERRPDGKAIGY